MEALKLVMPWLNAQELGSLAQTCRSMAEAGRIVTECRAGNVDQGLEMMAVPAENHADDCRYPYFHYTPFCQFSSPGSAGRRRPWGTAHARKVEVNEAEFGGAMATGNVLHDVGCECWSDCASSECSIPQDRHSAEGSARFVGKTPDLGPKPAETREEAKKGQFQEHTGEFVDPKCAEDGQKKLPPRKRKGNGRFKSLQPGETHFEQAIASAGCVPQIGSYSCGRIVGGHIAYDSFSRLESLRRYKKVPISSGVPGDAEQQAPVGGSHCATEKGSLIPRLLKEGSMEADCQQQHQEELDGPTLVMECGPACSCSPSCSYRVSQHGAAVQVKVVRTKFKGWSLCANQDIVQGSFVCEYGGELITTHAARERHIEYDEMHGKDWQGSALLVLREHLPSGSAALRVNIDATRLGNVARFINHACNGGNLVPCLIRPAGCIIPKLALFARRDIAEGEELTYSYGTAAEASVSSKPCFCGTSACQGWLPSEFT